MTHSHSLRTLLACFSLVLAMGCDSDDTNDCTSGCSDSTDAIDTPPDGTAVTTTCASRPCRNGGACVTDTANSYTCDCAGTGHSGARCEVRLIPDPLSGCRGTLDAIGDGYCDPANNLAVCAYDGGDCCRSTCESTLFECGGYVHRQGSQIGGDIFNCLNPEACENRGGCPDCAPGCNEALLGDGTCNIACFTADCGYDTVSGGGASDCTCEEAGLLTDCDSRCFEPVYEDWKTDAYCDDGRYGLNLVCPAFGNDADACDNADPPFNPGICEVFLDQIGDGWCDPDINIVDCDYDGGDCCISTCFDNAYPCSVNASDYTTCEEPDACENGSSCSCDDCAASELGDGTCHPACYHAMCDWDSSGGGPSDCTCVELGMQADCAGQCFRPLYDVWVGDGHCDDGAFRIDLNCTAFSFDGGDCGTP